MNKILSMLAEKLLVAAGKSAENYINGVKRRYESPDETRLRHEQEHRAWAAETRKRYKDAGLPEPEWLRKFPF